MLRAVAIVVLALAAVALAAPKPPRADCVESALKVTFDSVNADKLTVVALSDDLGPSTLAAAYAGTVYVYYRTVTNETTKKGSRLVYGQWTQIQTIVTDSILEQESFGGALALSGDVLAVGQPRWAYRSSTQNEFTGAVYLYRRSGPGANYTYEDIVYERDNVGQVPPNALFGASVSLVRNGTVLLVGAPGCCPPDFIGQAFTYYYGVQGNDTTPSWGETNGPSQSQVFGLGTSVALADTNPGFVLMGAPGYNALTATGPGVYTAPISAAGVVDVSRRSALPLNVLTITPAPDPATSECGFALSDVDETRRRVIWSCPGFNGARGATYTSDLVGSQWSTSRRIGSPAPNAGGRFGQSLAYQDPMLIVTEAGLTGGLVHVFQVVPVTLKPEAYLNTQTFEFANSLPFDQYANLTISVDFRDNVLAVGAYAQLTVYDCPLPASPATPLRAALALVAALVALLLLAL